MAIIDDLTPALSLPLPHPDNDLADDVLRLRAALVVLDAAIDASDAALDAAAATLQTDNQSLSNLQLIGDAIVAAQDSLASISAFAGALVDDTGVAADKAWSSQRTAAEIGRGSATSYTYTDGVLTGISEALPGGTRTTTLSYTAGVLTSMAVVYAGVTRTTTYTYSSGVLTSTSTVES